MEIVLVLEWDRSRVKYCFSPELSTLITRDRAIFHLSQHAPKPTDILLEYVCIRVYAISDNAITDLVAWIRSTLASSRSDISAICTDTMHQNLTRGRTDHDCS